MNRYYERAQSWYQGSLRGTDRSLQNLRWLVLHPVLVLGVFLATGFFGTAMGKDKAGKPAMGANNEVESPFSELSFDAVEALPGDGVADVDATPEGRERLQIVITRAREIFRERDLVEKERRPLAIPRDILAAEVAQLQQVIVMANAQIIAGNNLLSKLQRALRSSNSSEQGAILGRIGSVQGQIQGAQGRINTSNSQIADRQPRLNALNIQIQPLDERLRKLWEELTSCRKQWLEIRQPQRKYAHGNFDGLKQVLNDWLLIDGLWPEAFCWAALCDYELGDYESAWNQIDKAEKIRQELYYPKSWAQGEALRGLIAFKIPAVKSKASGMLQSAQLHVNKNKKSDWQTYFLLGRAFYEQKKQAGKAKANFERALKISVNTDCVKFWYGKLLTTTTESSVADIPGGTTMLEKLWTHSAKNSWRLSTALALAYDAASESDKADQIWTVTLELAPKAEHDSLTKLRADAMRSSRDESKGASERSNKAKMSHSPASRTSTARAVAS